AGAPANAPAWLSEAASWGWANPAAAAATPGEAWPDEPPGGDVVPGPDGSLGPGGEAAGRLQRLIGALLQYTERSDGIFGWIWRAPVALFQLRARLPITGVPDPVTLEIRRFLSHRR